MVMRGAKRKGVRYFGPYAHAYAIRETLDLLLRTFPIRTCTKNKFDRHHRLGPAVPLRAHREVRGAVRRRRHPRGVRRPRPGADRLPRRRDRADPRPARQADARGDRRAGVRARGAPPRPDHLGRARPSSASRWSTPRRRTTTPSGWSTTSSRRRCRCSSCARAGSSAARALVVDKVEDVDAPELVGRLLEQLYGGADAHRHPARDPRPGATRRRPALRGVPHRARGEQGSRIRVPRRGAKRELLQTVTQNADEAFHAAQAPPRVGSQRPRARPPRAAGGARTSRSAAAHRVLRHLEPAGHRDRRVDGGDGRRPAEALRLPALQDAPSTARTTSPRWKRCSPAASGATSRSATKARVPASGSRTRRTCCSSTAARVSSAWRCGCSKSSGSRTSASRASRSASRRSTCPGESGAGAHPARLRGAVPAPTGPRRGAPVRDHVPPPAARQEDDPLGARRRARARARPPGAPAEGARVGEAPARAHRGGARGDSRGCPRSPSAAHGAVYGASCTASAVG